MKYRKVNDRPLTDVWSVHITAEFTRPETSPRLFARRRNSDPAEHRRKVHFNALHLAFGQIENSRVALAIDFPDKASRRDRIVKHGCVFVVGERAEVRSMC